VSNQSQISQNRIYNDLLKFCDHLLTVMLFQTHKTFVHLRNTNEHICNET